MKRVQLSALLALAAAFNVAPVSAATVTECGTDVCFTYDNSTKYGSANIVGNTIFFLPTNFKAESLNGAGFVTSNETLNVQITALGNYQITGFGLAESGDYLLNGTDASVSVTGQLRATSNTQIDPAPPGFLPYIDTQVFDAGPLTAQGTATEWQTSAAIDFSNTAGWDTDTDVTVTLENLLSARTLNNGEQAFVEKKFGGVGISVVPIPGAALLFPSALGMLAWVRRRRQS